MTARPHVFDQMARDHTSAGGDRLIGPAFRKGAVRPVRRTEAGGA